MLRLMFPAEDAAMLDRLRDLPSEQQLDYFRQRAELAQIVMAGAGPGHARYIYEVFQANLNAVLAFRPRPYAGPVTLFRASTAATPMHRDPLLGWGHWTTGEVDVLEVEGDHVTLFREPAIRSLAATLEAALARSAMIVH